VISLDDLDLSVRTYNCLRRAGYSTVKEVRNLSQEQLNNIRNLGTKQQEELVDKIELTRRK
jgi:DNA-directed RNA polymerase subunit alpha